MDCPQSALLIHGIRFFVDTYMKGQRNTGAESALHLWSLEVLENDDHRIEMIRMAHYMPSLL